MDNIFKKVKDDAKFKRNFNSGIGIEEMFDLSEDDKEEFAE